MNNSKLKVMQKQLTKCSMVVALAVGSLLNAQVGINAGEVSKGYPHEMANDAILHVENKTSENKGVLLPSVGLISDTDQATTSNGTVTEGLMVWNDGTAGLTPAGYYYWNGSKWILTGNVEGGSDNIYSANGTLSEDRIVTQDGHDITYTTGSGKFIIDGTSNLKGGSYVNTTEVTGSSYTVTDKDYYISVHTNDPTGQVDITVPAPSKDTKGRVLIITNKSAGSVVILNPDGSQALNGTQQSSIPVKRGQWIVNDGTKWFNLINY